MKKEREAQFNREVENYRRSLLYFAGACEWDEFKARAGRLFDYIESIEFSELERRFFRIFMPVLGLLVLAVGALVNIDFSVRDELLRLKNVFILAALCASTFELYFYLDFRAYVGIRTANSKRRREIFIRNMEHDFRGPVVRP